MIPSNEPEKNPFARTKGGWGTTLAELLPIAAFAAIVLFAIAGIRMLQIHSESGDSIAEEFYHELGIFSIGIALLTLIISYHVFRKR